MASVTFSGISGEIAKFDGLAKGADEACRRAVKAGADLLSQRLSEAAPVDTGALSRSIRAGKIDYSAGDGYSCDVGPKGEHHGESLAKIGNILEYGRSNLPARPWFHPTVERSRAEVTQAMQEAFEGK